MENLNPREERSIHKAPPEEDNYTLYDLFNKAREVVDSNSEGRENVTIVHNGTTVVISVGREKVVIRRKTEEGAQIGIYTLTRFPGNAFLKDSEVFGSRSIHDPDALRDLMEILASIRESK